MVRREFENGLQERRSEEENEMKTRKRRSIKSKKEKKIIIIIIIIIIMFVCVPGCRGLDTGIPKNFMPFSSHNFFISFNFRLNKWLTCVICIVN